MQIIASAGSGKTEVVSQRVAHLLASGEPADSIVAFTFTERAAEELRDRIAARVEEQVGRDALDRLGGLFVGTIHAYCFRLLQQRVPRYETYDVLDENRLTAFLSRVARRLGIKQLDPRDRLFASIAIFLKNFDVVENELLDPESMPEPFRGVLLDYYAALERYRLLTYGQQIVCAVSELERSDLRDQVHANLRHLIVDEYQDVNPAQERLIELLAGPKVELCVVGDDDQAIYQWRGSDVSNIVGFRERYPEVATFELTTNRRSRPQIIEVANGFARTIPDRLDKEMKPSRPAGDGGPAVAVWDAPTEAEEAERIALTIRELADRGVPYRDMAVLVRGRTSYPALLDKFAEHGIPVQTGGRTGLFEQPEARTLGRAICWLTDIGWREGYAYGAPVKWSDLIGEFVAVFDLAPRHRQQLEHLLRSWKAEIASPTGAANLVGELYELLEVLRVWEWDLDDPLEANRLGTLARFTSLLADYESVRRRARVDDEAPGRQVGGQDRGDWYHKNLAFHILNHAIGSYEGFDGEPDFAMDAVDLTTVHRAKGLEWPVVFVPSMTKNRFPTSKAGKEQPWLVPRDRFAADRYEGGDADERRLFYVAITRARDWVSVSRHERVTKQKVKASAYHQALSAHLVDEGTIALPEIEPRTGSAEEPVTLSFSQLASFLDCGMAFRLRSLIGFEPRLAPELGYGKAVHHILRAVAERTRLDGRVPDSAVIGRILDEGFYLPTANKAAHDNLKAAARKLVERYAKDHADDLRRVWETERPFELRLDGITVIGRADVILDHEGGVPGSLALVDYKTSTNGDPGVHDLQLQVYVDAGRREGLTVRGAYVHDLGKATRTDVEVDSRAVAAAEKVVREAADRIRARDYLPAPGSRCRGCEVRTVCAAAKRSKT
jgi:DNA helicase-2/ATP-dependent DNA helicase PcrA